MQVEKLRSLYAYLCGSNLAYALILALVVKAIISDVSYATFLLTIPVLGYESFKLYLKAKKPDPIVINNEVMDRLDKLQAKVNAGAFEKNIIPTAPAKRYF